MRISTSSILSSTLACALALAAGCASTSGRFPTRDELQELQATAPPAHVAPHGVVEAPTWALTGPLADSIGVRPHTATTGWERLLAETAAQGNGLIFPSEAMHCVARETGKFQLAKGGLPDDDLTRFIASRCGSPAGH